MQVKKKEVTEGCPTGTEQQRRRHGGQKVCDESGGSWFHQMREPSRGAVSSGGSWAEP